MRTLNAFKAMDDALRQNNLQGIPTSIRERYVSMLVSRAVRFYIEGELDAFTVDEDLADGTSDTGFYETGHPLRKTDLCNLIESEEHEAEFQKSLK